MKKDYLIIIFLLLGPLLDVTSFYGLQVSILVRGLYLAVITIYLLIKKKDLKVVIPLLIFSIIYLVYQVIYMKTGISSNISSVLKLLYLPLSILFFKNYNFKRSKEKYLTIIILSYIGIYLLSFGLGIGESAYLTTDGKSGFKGIFASINEFSAILVILLPIALTYMKNTKWYFLLPILIVGSIGSALLIGTKVLLGGIVVSLIYLLFKERDRLFLKRSNIQKIVIVISVLIVLISGGFIFTKTRTYKNMLVQQEFFQVENVFSYKFVNRVVYNDRLTFLEENYNYFKNKSITTQLLGIGMTDSMKMVEIDIFDILFRYGIIGFIIFIYSLVSVIKIKDLTSEGKLALFLGIAISLTSGHVLIYPAVSIYFALL